MKPFNEYLAMTAEQIMADPEAPESLRIAARIELEKAQKFNLEAEAARTATDKPGLSIGFRKGWITVAIVAEYHYPNGTVCIDDDSYRERSAGGSSGA